MSRPPLALPSSARLRARSWRATLDVLWRFSRPHTLIGTTLSILGIYALGPTDAFDLFWTIVAGAGVNLYIVGVNQVQDVEIDRVNKPELPIAAGELSLAVARRIVGACAALALVLALTQGLIELGAVGLGLAIGWAYSCPPLHLKRFPALASLSITLVRTLVVNLGVWLHFSDGGAIHPGVWALCAITLPFSLAIAILKDVPDAEGDRRFDIATFTVRVGPRPVLGAGLAALTAGLAAMAVLGPALLSEASATVLIAGHVAALALLWWWARGLDPARTETTVTFYQRVWRLFFLEYVLIPAAFLIG